MLCYKNLHGDSCHVCAFPSTCDDPNNVHCVGITIVNNSKLFVLNSFQRDKKFFDPGGCMAENHSPARKKKQTSKKYGEYKVSHITFIQYELID